MPSKLSGLDNNHFARISRLLTHTKTLVHSVDLDITNNTSLRIQNTTSNKIVIFFRIHK
jgi:hypothetical protein